MLLLPCLPYTPQPKQRTAGGRRLEAACRLCIWEASCATLPWVVSSPSLCAGTGLDAGCRTCRPHPAGCGTRRPTRATAVYLMTATLCTSAAGAGTRRRRPRTRRSHPRHRPPHDGHLMR
jgi:hypothetical protein